jgi:hypothetical protein
MDYFNINTISHEADLILEVLFRIYCLNKKKSVNLVFFCKMIVHICTIFILQLMKFVQLEPISCNKENILKIYSLVYHNTIFLW